MVYKIDISSLEGILPIIFRLCNNATLAPQTYSESIAMNPFSGMKCYEEGTTLDYAGKGQNT